MYSIFVWVILCFVKSTVETTEFCASFQFNFSDNIKDESTVSIDFSFSNFHCDNHFFILISSFHERSKTYNVRCKLYISDGNCKTNSTLCGCTEKRLRYWFRAKLRQSDSTKWKWSTSGQEAEAKILNVTMPYPYRLANLTVDGKDGPVHLVHGKKSVQIKCLWIKGYPASNVRLVDSINYTLSRSDTESNELSHQMNFFQCQKEQVIRCEVERSDQRLTTTIVVTCPPLLHKAFENIVSTAIGQRAIVRFPLRLGIFNVSECHVTKYMDTHESPTISSIHYCPVETITSNKSENMTLTSENGLLTFQIRKKKCECTVHGSKPNLTLTLHIFQVEMFDDGRWVLTVTNMEGNSSSDFQIQVLNPFPRITGLTLNGQGSQNAFSVPVNQSVQIECTWDNGFPLTTARLIDAHGNLLANSSTDRTIRHSFASVNCTHSGIIRCEANSSQRNMSALLLVKCPPTMNKTHQPNVSASSGQDAIFSIQVRSHSESIAKCFLTKYLNQINDNKDNSFSLSSTVHVCIVKHFSTGSTQIFHEEQRSQRDEQVAKCTCTLNGTPPDLFLTLHIFHVTLHDGGCWNLTVANHEGNDNQYIFLQVIQFTEKAVGQMWLTVAAASIPLTVVAVIFTVVTMVVRNRKLTGIIHSQSSKRFEIQSHRSEADVKLAGTKKSNISCCHENTLSNIPIEMFESAKCLHVSVNKQNDNEFVSKVQHGELSTNFAIGSMVHQVNCDIDQTENASTYVHTVYLTPCQSETSRLHVTSKEVCHQEPQYDVSSLVTRDDGYLNPSLTGDQPASTLHKDLQSLSTNEVKEKTLLSVIPDAGVSENQTATSCENSYESYYETLE